MSPVGTDLGSTEQSAAAGEEQTPFFHPTALLVLSGGGEPLLLGLFVSCKQRCLGTAPALGAGGAARPRQPVPETVPGFVQPSREAKGIYFILKGFAGCTRAIELEQLEILLEARCTHSDSCSDWPCRAAPSSPWWPSCPIPVPIAC